MEGASEARTDQKDGLPYDQLDTDLPPWAKKVSQLKFTQPNAADEEVCVSSLCTVNNIELLYQEEQREDSDKSNAEDNPNYDYPDSEDIADLNSTLEDLSFVSDEARDTSTDISLNDTDDRNDQLIERTRCL